MMMPKIPEIGRWSGADINEKRLSHVVGPYWTLYKVGFLGIRTKIFGWATFAALCQALRNIQRDTKLFDTTKKFGIYGEVTFCTDENRRVKVYFYGKTFSRKKLKNTNSISVLSEGHPITGNACKLTITANELRKKISGPKRPRRRPL